MISLKNKMTFVYTLVLSFLLLISIVNAQGIGVSEGDWFRYSVEYSFESDDENEEPQRQYEVVERIDEVEVIIHNISGSKISYYCITYYENGSQIAVPGGLYLDVETGERDATIIAPFFIQSNLDSGDVIFSDESYVKINQTVDCTYPEGSRETNLVHFFDSGETPDGGHGYIEGKFFWDKETGVLIEYDYNYEFTVGDNLTKERFNSKLIESNVPAIPEFQEWFLIFLFVTGTLSIIIIKKRPYRFRHNVHTTMR